MRQVGGRMKFHLNASTLLLLVFVCSAGFASAAPERHVFPGVYTTWGDAATVWGFKEFASIPYYSKLVRKDGDLRTSTWAKQVPGNTLGKWPNAFRIQVRSLTPSGKLFLSSTFVDIHSHGRIRHLPPAFFDAVDVKVNEGTCYGDGLIFLPSKWATSESGYDLFSDTEPVMPKAYYGADALAWLDGRKKIVNNAAGSALEDARAHLKDPAAGAGLHIHPQGEFGILSFGDDFLFVFPRKDKGPTHVELWREERFSMKTSLLFRAEGMYAVISGYESDEEDYCWGPTRTYRVSDSGVQRGSVENSFRVLWR